MAEETLHLVLLFAVLVIDGLALAALWRGAGTGRHKVGWSLAILLLPGIGVVGYLLWGHGPRDAHLPP